LCGVPASGWDLSRSRTSFAPTRRPAPGRPRSDELPPRTGSRSSPQAGNVLPRTLGGLQRSTRQARAPAEELRTPGPGPRAGSGLCCTRHSPSAEVSQGTPAVATRSGPPSSGQTRRTREVAELLALPPICMPSHLRGRRLDRTIRDGLEALMADDRSAGARLVRIDDLRRPDSERAMLPRGSGSRPTLVGHSRRAQGPSPCESLQLAGSGDSATSRSMPMRSPPTGVPKAAIASWLGTVQATVYNRLRKLREPSGS
jgi:hypothetical protein